MWAASTLPVAYKNINLYYDINYGASSPQHINSAHMHLYMHITVFFSVLGLAFFRNTSGVPTCKTSVRPPSCINCPPSNAISDPFMRALCNVILHLHDSFIFCFGLRAENSLLARMLPRGWSFERGEKLLIE